MLRQVVAGLVVTAAFLFVTERSDAADYVRGYTRSNGTYVSPHYRSHADGSFWNNWSTYPNINPYTGNTGTRYTPSPSYGSRYQPSGGLYRPYGSLYSPRSRSW
jgi:hypothetical protein